MEGERFQSALLHGVESKKMPPSHQCGPVCARISFTFRSHRQASNITDKPVVPVNAGEVIFDVDECKLTLLHSCYGVPSFRDALALFDDVPFTTTTIFRPVVTTRKCVTFNIDPENTEPGCYTFSGHTSVIQPCPACLYPLVIELRSKGYEFDAIHCNLFTECSTSLGFHQDNEKIIKSPVIIGVNIYQEVTNSRSVSFRPHPNSNLLVMDKLLSQSPTNTIRAKLLAMKRRAIQQSQKKKLALQRQREHKKRSSQKDS
jgi:hypothetical protein